MVHWMSFRRAAVAVVLVVASAAPSSVSHAAKNSEPQVSPAIKNVSQMFLSNDCKFALQFWVKPLAGATGNLSYVTAMPGSQIVLEAGTMSNLVPESLRSFAPPGTTNFEVAWCADNNESNGLGTQILNQTIALDLDGDGSFETDTNRAGIFEGGYANIKINVPNKSNYFYKVYAQWRTPQGETITGAITVFVDVDCGISINDGDEYTNSRQVRLTINPCPGAETARISNDGGFKQYQTFETASVVDWTIPSSRTGTFTKVVYGKYVGLPAGAISDDIILDTTKPALGEVSVQRSGVSASALRATKVKITTSAKDTISGVKYIEVTNDKSEVGRRLVYKKVVPFTSRGSRIHIRVVDKAGNVSPWRTIPTP